MIGSLRGTVVSAGADQLLIDVNGVGYLVSVTAEQARSLREGSEVSVLTVMIVREDAVTLFGFRTPEEKGLFDVLRTVSGVGPKLALAVLSGLSPQRIAQAVADEDAKTFQTISGIGAKTAKLITVQLAGRIAPPAPAQQTSTASAAVSVNVVAALVGLGWAERDAQEAVARAVEVGAKGDDALLRAALALLGGAR
ncbi:MULTISPECIES: Holliday junction branch migration protein RuvA [unclassified Pseudoclavibacter]|uniref:Holliday junction branch migration protein RuvA n=1 Tax=unclassified Pseudoclavibacter TaxID=2615177 RepID=UPI0013017450|nr:MULTISPECIES: Holliday junction branch migration protein RuvA [unclassified Pseudoclavibacter]KAB1646438.1 Holliday junction branch migration protein RuvA [Pseudoclavibacter sp. CFCC 14310]KAB1658214.1 Holliday junction branch migration protein RuvA [Pseudoclavibacter sp. CFCC 11306]KAB1661876.1 Holliday junction branch migration protein RuvA [Pseudoclavibacter sp. CFCC 13796]KAB1663402.1 Holliday junction branch migration protein RuvA [Pseudoclavibacter sp. CFCC 13611]